MREKIMKWLKIKPIKATYYKFIYLVKFVDGTYLKLQQLDYWSEDWEGFCEDFFKSKYFNADDKSYLIGNVKSLEKVEEKTIEKEFYCSYRDLPDYISE